MNGLIHHLRLLGDPRGRADRQNLLVAAIVVVILEIFVAIGPIQTSDDWLSPATVIKAVGLWICGASVIKRLHDLDLSGWWLPGGLALACMWTAIVAIVSFITVGSAILQPGHAGGAVILGIVMLPVLGATLWLHLVPGSEITNRFGLPVRANEAASQSPEAVAQQ